MSRCPECGSVDISWHSHTGESSCRNCGLILDESPFEKPVVSEFVKSTAHYPSISHAGGLGMDGKIVKNSWIYSTREKNINQANIRINNIASQLKLPEYVIKEAKLIFKSAVDKGLNIGRDNSSFVYGSIYTACSMHCLPKTPLEIVAFTDMTEKRMMRAHRILVKELKLKVNICDPLDLIPRFASKIGLSQKSVTKAVNIVMRLKGSRYITGKNPKTIVAAALYLASKECKEKVPQRIVANAIGVLEITIRKRSHEIEEYVGI